jgi:hypothetical protein
VPFDVDIGGQSKHYRLYRVICLYVGADYLLEELFLRSESKDEASKNGQWFTARYFCHMDMGLSDKNIFRYPSVPDWFALGESVSFPYPGYGFATDVHARDPGRQSDGQHGHKRFRWEIEHGTSATCLHTFMLREQPPAPGEFGHFDARAGRNWYELIYKPLRAEFEEDWLASHNT